MKDVLNQWLAFLDMERGDLLEMAMKENGKIKDAIKEYNELAGDAEVKRLAEVRLMAQLEENAALASARAKGEEKGMKDGKKQANIEMAKKLLKMKMPIEQIKEITGLSEKEIRKIK